MKKLSQLLAALPRYQIPTEPVIATSKVDINKITSDSRQVGPGDLFVARR